MVFWLIDDLLRDFPLQRRFIGCNASLGNRGAERARFANQQTSGTNRCVVVVVVVVVEHSLLLTVCCACRMTLIHWDWVVDAVALAHARGMHELMIGYAHSC